jgi:hypothetical protein
LKKEEAMATREVRDDAKPPVKLRAVSTIKLAADKTVAPGELFEIDQAEADRLVKIGAAVVSPALTGE